MIRPLTALACALAITVPVAAQEEPPAAPSPGEIVAAAPASEWIAIAPEDLLVMTLAPDRDGKPRQVVIQLMPAPFSQGWVDNIRTLARAEWYDGIAVTRVQDNYVVQWGDPNGEDAGKAKPLPEGLKVVKQAEYVVGGESAGFKAVRARLLETAREKARVAEINARLDAKAEERNAIIRTNLISPPLVMVQKDPYASAATFENGWPVALDRDAMWPVHCYGMVGVGRGMSPDTGTGAELYTVIGHAPRHLDRNIALVGRVVEGIEHLSSLPRGTGPLGFYEDPAQHVPIVSIRVAVDLPAADPASSSEAVGRQERPKFEYLSTEGETFARYADARANRRDPFFIVPAGGADICNIPVPVRRAQ